MAEPRFPLEPPDFEGLASALGALASPLRLELLWRLRVPHAAGDLALAPRRGDGAGEPRPVAASTLLEHLERLEEIGVVQRAPSARGRGAEWTTNVPQIFSRIEELRALTRIPLHAAVEPDRTVPLGGGDAPGWPAGPKLVFASGPREGAIAPLEGPGPWALGRAVACEVPLEYDAFASARHATVERRGRDLVLAPEPDALNPTRVNLRPVADATRLVHGDVVSIGRTHLLYHGA